ncbi:hypothetical protein DOY81_013362 [Sarcophaga bullata]|nr:hypothetical protein DOY81_013362 [Sarcophaga bullata]
MIDNHDDINSARNHHNLKHYGKSNNDICSIVTEINENSDGNRNHNASNLRRISSDDLSDLAKIMDDPNDMDEDGDNFPNESVAIIWLVYQGT